MASEKAEALDAARRALEFAPADPAHRDRLQKLERGGDAPGVGLVELNFGGLMDVSTLKAPAPQKGKEEGIDRSRSLDQLFIR